MADDITLNINAWNADGEPFTPAQVDGIVAQLLHHAPHFTDKEVATRDITAAAAEIKRLNRLVAEQSTVIFWWEDAWEKAGQPGELGRMKSEGMLSEIIRLRAALALAVGELSGHPPHTSTHPDELMHQLLEEARRG